MQPIQVPRGTPRAACASVVFASLSLAASSYAQGQSIPEATQFKESRDGIGHMLVVPYYTVQAGNATLLNIVNTDRRNGKAVKVRFRGARNADDVFNFTLFLSPGDVWAAEISLNRQTGLAQLSTADDSCTLPTNVNRDFNTDRVRPDSVWAETREGYIDIITMADLVEGSPVYAATKHEYNKLPAPCSLDAEAPPALKALETEAGVSAAGFGVPTSGLFANWSIFNVANATSWAGAAAAIVAVDKEGVVGSGKVVVHPQAAGTPTGAVSDWTSDPLLRSGGVAIQHFDLPDLSTPYVGGITAVQQAALLSGVWAKTSVRNEYFTDDRVNAATDWVFTLPTRRYSMAVDYAASKMVYTVLSPEYFNASNVWFSNGIDSCIRSTPFIFWNRASQYWNDPKEVDDYGIPQPDMAYWINLCGAASVLHYETSGRSALNAAVAVDKKGMAFGFKDGWGEVFTRGLNNVGLPIVGAAFAKATSTNIGAGISGNFGLTWPHRYTRPSAGAQ